VVDQELRLDSLAERHSGLTPALGECYYEAASVCLSRHHQTPVSVSVDCLDVDSTCGAKWIEPDQRTRLAWANALETTEAGAYALALTAIELFGGLVAVSRAETLTGADYYVAPLGTFTEDLENCFRLEVSGTDSGDAATIHRRLLGKMSQAAAGDSNLPAIASVVGFRELAIVIAKVMEAE
jgi:hypothetical protein